MATAGAPGMTNQCVQAVKLVLYHAGYATAHRIMWRPGGGLTSAGHSAHNRFARQLNNIVGEARWCLWDALREDDEDDA